MIDWLDANGFGAPVVVARGSERLGPLRSRLFFLMRAVPGELTFEEAWRAHPGERRALVEVVADRLAALHERGFHHRDCLARHLRMDRSERGWRIRQIDLERASAGARRDPAAAADLVTLAASCRSVELRREILGPGLERYLARRTRLDPARFRARLARTRPHGGLPHPAA